MKFIALITIVLSLSSCSSNLFSSRTVENYYQSAGVEKYFLSDIPAWANFSETGECFRKYTTRYFDIDSLMKNYGINFEKAIQIQGTFNDEYNRLYDGYKQKAIPLSEEQLLFFKTSEKVNGRINFFTAPTFKRINLIWVDSALKDKDEKEKVLKFLKSPVNDLGMPVLVSLCMTKKEIEEYFPSENFKAITSEMFSIYNSKGEKAPYLRFYFDEFFKKDQELYFYSRTKNNVNNVFNGIKKFNNF